MAIGYSISYTFSPSTTISSSQVNQNFTDNSNTWNGLEAKTMTFSNLGVDTELKSGGTIKSANGTVAAPGITFTNSTGSGLYRVGADDIAVSTAGVIALEVSNAQLITAYNNIVFSPTTKGIKGTTTNDDAAALNVGEYVSSTVGATNSPATGVIGDLTSISLTAGDWDVSGMALTNVNSAASVSEVNLAITTTSGNSSTGFVDGDTVANITGTVCASTVLTLAVPLVRMSLSATTTVYLKYKSVFSGSNPQYKGSIKARRRR